MGFERTAIFGIIELHLEATAGGSLTLSTDLPGNAMAVRETKGIPVTGRRILRFRLNGTTKGRLYSVKVSPTGSGIIRLYGGRIWARMLPGNQWSWYAIPIPETSEEWSPVKLPIPPIGEWEARPIPIPPMGEWEARPLPIPGLGEWEARQIPIPPTSDWNPQQMPIKPTPANPEWVNLQVDE